MCTCWCPFFPSSNTSWINSHITRAYNSGQPTPPSSSTYSSACSWRISPSTGHIHSSTILNSTGSIKNTMSMYILCQLLLHMPIQWSSYWETWSLQESGIIYWLSLHLCILWVLLFGLRIGWWRLVRYTLDIVGVGSSWISCHIKQDPITIISIIRIMWAIMDLCSRYGIVWWAPISSIFNSWISRMLKNNDPYFLFI